MAARKKKPMMTLTITHSLSLASNSTRILPWVVLAGCEATTDRSTLDMLGASYILNASSEIKSWFVDDEKFHYLHVPIDDEPTCDVRAFFAPAHAFCDDVRARHLAGERVGLVVHCKTGMSRSSTMLLAHLMMAKGVRLQVAQVTGRVDCLGAGCSMCRAAEAAGGVPAAEAGCREHGMTLRDALSFIRERRPRASPNAGFMAQLIELEAQLFNGAVTIDLDKYRQDRFGDVRTFCIGDIDAVVGYTGLGAGSGGDAAGGPGPLSIRGAGGGGSGCGSGAPKTPGSVKSGHSGDGSFGQASAGAPQPPGFASLTRMPSAQVGVGPGGGGGGTGMPPLILPVDLTPSGAGGSSSGAGGGNSINALPEALGVGVERPRRLSEQRNELPLPLGPVAIPLPPSTTRATSTRALRGFTYSYDDDAGAGGGAPAVGGTSPATPSVARAQFRAAHGASSVSSLLPAPGLSSGARRSTRLASSGGVASDAAAPGGAPAQQQQQQRLLPSPHMRDDAASEASSDRAHAERAMLLTPVRGGSGEPPAPPQPAALHPGGSGMSDSPASLPSLLERRRPSCEAPPGAAGGGVASGAAAQSPLPGIAAGPTAVRRRSLGGAAGPSDSFFPSVGNGSSSPSAAGGSLSRPPLGGGGAGADSGGAAGGAFAPVEPSASSPGAVRDARSLSGAGRRPSGASLPGLARLA